MDDAERAPEILAELVTEIRGTLGDDLVAVYVYGSYITGGFDRAVSDLDLVAITRRDAASVDLAGLREMHRTMAGRHPAWADRLEVVYVSNRAVASFRSSKGRLAVISPGEPFHLRDERPAEWIQNWYLVRETGVALFGPTPRTLIPAIGWSEFARALERYAAELAGRDLAGFSPGYLAYTVLTICRAERAVIDGMHTSKQDAASWGRQRHPESAWLIHAAVRCRLARGVVGFDDSATRSAAIAFIRLIAADIGATTRADAV